MSCPYKDCIKVGYKECLQHGRKCEDCGRYLDGKNCSAGGVHDEWWEEELSKILPPVRVGYDGDMSDHLRRMDIKNFIRKILACSQ